MKKTKRQSMRTERLVVNESFALHKSKGNGILKRQVWINDNEQVTRYSLAYINVNYFSGDNGRVLGYDNAHGYHHKHYMGKVEAVNFINFAVIEEQFQREFEVLHEKIRKK